MKPWLVYSIVRLGLFALAFAVLSLLGFDWLWAALLAAVIGFCVSYLAFDRLRRQVATSLAERRAAPAVKDADSSAEDDALDERGAPGPARRDGTDER